MSNGEKGKGVYDKFRRSTRYADSLKKRSKRTSTKVGPSGGGQFTVKGGSKQVSGGKPNFTRVPSNTGVPATIKKKSMAIAGEVVDKTPYQGTTLPATLAKKTSRLKKYAGKAGRFVGKYAPKVARVAGPVGAVVAALDQEPLGEGSDEIPGRQDSRAPKAGVAGAAVELVFDQLQETKIPLRGEAKKSSELRSSLTQQSDDEEGKQQKQVEGIGMLQSSPEVAQVAKDLVDNEDLDEKTKGEVMGQIDAISKGKEPLKEKGSISGDFTQALTYFLPQIIGGLVGGIAEGGEGALAGLQAGQKMRSGLDAYELERAKLEEKQKKGSRKKTDITPGFIHKGTKQPLTTRETEEGVEIIDLNNNIVDPSEAIFKEDYINERRQARIDDRQGKNLTLREGQRIDSNKKTFVTRVKPELDSLRQVNDLKDLLKADTRITGLIDFKMAKGIAGEVGNLAEGERKAAAQLLGWKGKVEATKEWFVGRLGEVRREEIEKLIDIMEKGNKSRIKEKASRHSKSASKRLKIKEMEYVQELLDETGQVFEEDKKPLMSNSQKKRLQLLRKKYPNRN